MEKFVINNPIKTEIQSDGRIQKWARISEVNQYILLKNGKTVHNAFFDRAYKKELKTR